MSRGRPVRPGLGQVDGPDSAVRLRLFGLVLAAALLAACGGAASGGTGTPRTWSLVALGDSVPYGTNCDSDDGDHPNEAGHQKIAAAAVDVIEATLKI